MITTVVNMSESIAKKHNITKKLAREIVDDVFNIISEELMSRNKVQIKCFGTFEVYDRKARTVRGFEGNDIAVPEKAAMHFVPSRILKESIESLPVTDTE